MNKPLAFGPDHFARGAVGMFIAKHFVALGLMPDLVIARRDFEACGFLVGVELLDAFRNDLVWPTRDAATAVRCRLFRFKLARRWAAFERELAVHRARIAA